MYIHLNGLEAKMKKVYELDFTQRNPQYVGDEEPVETGGFTVSNVNALIEYVCTMSTEEEVYPLQINPTSLVLGDVQDSDGCPIGSFSTMTGLKYRINLQKAWDTVIAENIVRVSLTENYGNLSDKQREELAIKTIMEAGTRRANLRTNGMVVAKPVETKHQKGTAGWFDIAATTLKFILPMVILVGLIIAFGPKTNISMLLGY
jgi:hypothetical protein